MITTAIAIRDTVANVFTQPVFTNSIGGAIREFGDRCRGDKKDLVAMHPEHFELYEIGAYNDETAEIIPLKPPKQIATGANYVA